MRARFLHLADCHLGYRQYGRNERFNDFSKAFYAVMDVAVEEKVDFVVLAGDLFQKRSIDALTLSHAMRGLEKLQRAGIPCLAVEGNHELAYFNESIGWMRFLPFGHESLPEWGLLLIVAGAAGALLAVLLGLPQQNPKR